MNEKSEVSRDTMVKILATPTAGETWAQKKRRHRVLDEVLRSDGPRATPMRKRHASGQTGNGLVMRRPEDGR
jgi:hypothetical protein